MGWKFEYHWFIDLRFNFMLIFIGYSCISYAKGFSIKSQRGIVYLAYIFFIISIIQMFLPDDFLFYNTFQIEESIIKSNTFETDSLNIDTSK